MKHSGTQALDNLAFTNRHVEKQEAAVGVKRMCLLIFELI